VIYYHFIFTSSLCKASTTIRSLSLWGLNLRF